MLDIRFNLSSPTQTSGEAIVQSVVQKAQELLEDGYVYAIDLMACAKIFAEISKEIREIAKKQAESEIYKGRTTTLGNVEIRPSATYEYSGDFFEFMAKIAEWEELAVKVSKSAAGSSEILTDDGEVLINPITGQPFKVNRARKLESTNVVVKI
jgi:hypothetical protein